MRERINQSQMDQAVQEVTGKAPASGKRQFVVGLSTRMNLPSTIAIRGAETVELEPVDEYENQWRIRWYNGWCSGYAEGGDGNPMVYQTKARAQEAMERAKR